MRYYVLETQFRKDGDINFIYTEQYTFASALAYYWKRKSDYKLDTTYTKAAITLLDEELNPVSIPEGTVIETSYAQSSDS